MRIAIVGGSVAGLGLAWALRQRGLEPTIFERSSGHLEHRGTGVMLAPEVPLHLGIPSRPVERRLMLGRDGRVLWERPVVKRAAGWAEVYAALRHHNQDADLRSGCPVKEVDLDPPRLRVHDGWHPFDLVVGADGLASLVRSSLDPAFVPRYLGYVAVRGFLARESLPKGLPPVVEDIFDTAMGQLLMEGEHATFYGLPGERLNWMWYRNTPESELAHLLTDRQGVRHAWSLPPQTMHPEVEALLRQESRSLPPLLGRLLEATPTLFLQPVFSGSAAVSVGAGLVLIGDAAHLAVPHAGAGVTLALADAFSLAEALVEGTDLKAWERLRRQDATAHLDMAVRMGTSLQTPGKAWESFTDEDFSGWWKSVTEDSRLYFEPS